MMHITATIGTTSLWALLDSGSTHNFIDIGVAERAGVFFTGGAGQCVAVANGDCITSPGHCSALDIGIVDEHFIICCYGLSLGSFDMVFGVQWLESLRLVLWDFGLHTLAFVRNNHHVLWSTVASPCESCM
jgi:hypothetical protein